MRSADPLRILQPVFNSAAPSVSFPAIPEPFPGCDCPSGSRSKCLVFSCRLSRAPRRICGSPPDGLPPFNAGAAAHAEDAGGRGQTAAGPTPAPPRVQPQHMTVGRTASGRAAAGVGRREVFSRINNHRPSYG